MLPQPFVTSAMSQVEGLRVALDMNEEWQKVAGSKLVTGVLVVRKDAVENDPEAFAAFMDGYAASVEAANLTSRAPQPSASSTALSPRLRWPRRPCRSATSSLRPATR